MAALAVAAGGAVLLAGCGAPPAVHAAALSSASRSPSQTVAQMRQAVRAASSVHLSGVLSNGGKPIGLNLGLIRSGEFSGTLTQNGIPLTVIDAGGKAYVKATAAYLRELRAPAAVCSVMCGKYVEVTPAQARSLSGSLSMSALLSSFSGKLPPLTNAGTTTVNGQKGQVLRGPDGSRLVVAATGTPYPLQAVGRQGAGGQQSNGTLNFSQWNAVPRPVPPPASQVVNLSKITG
jgi:hypothetical protein